MSLSLSAASGNVAKSQVQVRTEWLAAERGNNRAVAVSVSVCLCVCVCGSAAVLSLLCFCSVRGIGAELVVAVVRRWIWTMTRRCRRC